jgi:hypothetical protein
VVISLTGLRWKQKTFSARFTSRCYGNDAMDAAAEWGEVWVAG